MSTTIETNPAALGAALLDEKRPGWAEKIDPERLNLTNVHDCVLGQLFGYYPTGATALGLDPWGEEADKHGFTSPDVPSDTDHWAELTQAWLGLVAERVGVTV